MNVDDLDAAIAFYRDTLGRDRQRELAAGAGAHVHQGGAVVHGGRRAAGVMERMRLSP